MRSNKNRLYIALYPSGVVNNEERRYHWGFLIGPKSERPGGAPGMRYHVKNRPIVGWVYDEAEVSDVRSTAQLLVRVLIAKVEDEERLVNILRNIPVIQDDPNWRCRTWVANALARIAQDGAAVGSAVLDWQQIETCARRYAAEKTASGRFCQEGSAMQPKPTWDMLANKELVP